MASAVHAEIDAIRATLPKGVTLQPFYDQSDIVSDSIASVRDAVLIGLALASLILVLFRPAWGPSLLAGLGLPATPATPQANAAGVKILAVSTAKRSPYLPQIPTLKEAGIDVDADAWMGMIAPAHTPEGIVAKIQREVVEAIGTAAVRDKLAAQLMEPVGNSPAEFRARIDGAIARWAPVIKAASIKGN